MNITDVRLNLTHATGACKAFGSFSLDGEFAIRGVRVMEDKEGKNFVAMPSRQKGDGSYEDVCFPLNKEMYHEISEAILNQYTQINAIDKSSEIHDKETKEEAVSKAESTAAEHNASKGKGR